MDLNDVLSFIGCATVVVMFASIVYGLISAIIARKPLDAIISLMFVLFLVFWTSSVILGGSPAPDAETQQELYEAGHYYLMSHGDYTEVSYEVYRYMQIMEIVGWGSCVISFVLVLIKSKTETGRFLARDKNENLFLAAKGRGIGVL